MVDDTHDSRQREWAKLSELKQGDTVTVDDGFDCLRPWTQHQVWVDSSNDLFIKCDHGYHGLKGQADNGNHLVGIYAGTVEAS